MTMGRQPNLVILVTLVIASLRGLEYVLKNILIKFVPFQKMFVGLRTLNFKKGNY
jgi:hypothetical protein